MIFRGAGGITDNNDMIAGLESVSRHALLTELDDAAPFHVPSHHLPARVLDVHLHVGMRIAKQHLDDGTIQRDSFIFQVCRAVGVVGVHTGRK